MLNVCWGAKLHIHLKYFQRGSQNNLPYPRKSADMFTYGNKEQIGY